jgi:hypothetical protein
MQRFRYIANSLGIIKDCGLTTITPEWLKGWLVRPLPQRTPRSLTPHLLSGQVEKISDFLVVSMARPRNYPLQVTQIKS